jgi:hypothetical protein
MTFRIFTNDRGELHGTAMFSAFRDIDAISALQAELRANRRFAYAGRHTDVKAIEWPPTSQASKDWLAKHT